MGIIRIRKKPYGEEDSQPQAYRPSWPYFNVGFGTEKDYFIDNLSLLIAAGVNLNVGLRSIRKESTNRRMKKVLDQIIEMIDAGYPLWKALEQTRFLPPRITVLIKTGEQSGRLPEHLNLVAIQQQKERIFASRIRSALLYPAIILSLAIIIGIGSAWYTLPKLVGVLSETQGSIPFTTQILIAFGDFIKAYGIIAMPILIAVVTALGYIVFVYKRTRFIGERILLFIPGINKLVQGVELARCGYIFGALLNAGLLVTDALRSLEEGAMFTVYKKFYQRLQENIEQGHSFESSFHLDKKSGALIPHPIQQMIITGEQSGKLSEIFMKIGQIFEDKTEAMTKDLAVILEPIVLVVVGGIVALVAFGILSPIYSLVGQIQ